MPSRNPEVILGEEKRRFLSRIWLSFLRIALVSGSAAALIIGSLLWLKRIEYEAYPKREPTAAKNYTTRTIDVSKDANVFTWVARKGEHPAPPLAMRIEPTDIYAWWFTGDSRSRQIAEAGDGPQRLVLEILVPSAEMLSTAAPECAEKPTGFECNMGRARVIVERDDVYTEGFEIVRGKRVLPRDEHLPHNQRKSRILREFWTLEDPKTARLQFKGWACDPPRQVESASTPPPPTSNQAFLPVQRSDCFELKRWWERSAPARFGYAKQKVYAECPPGGRCEAHSIFHGRLVQVQFEQVPRSEAQLARTQLFLTAWQALNRQHAGALKAPEPKADLAEAEVQLAVCQEAERALRRGVPLGSTLSVPCLRAGDIAMRLANAAPAEAAQILDAVANSLWKIDGRSVRMELFYEALLKSLEATGNGQSPAMVKALHRYLTRSSPVVSKTDPKLAYREELLSRAWSLARKLQGNLSDEDFEDVRTTLISHYSQLQKSSALIALYQESIADIENRQGTQSHLLMTPLQRMCYAQRDSDDWHGMKQTADRLLTVWLAQPDWRRTPEPGAARLREEQIGFGLVYLYYSYAFHEQQHAAVAPSIAEAVARMERTLGGTHAHVQAARFHQREVIARKTVAGPVGGGFLGR